MNRKGCDDFRPGVAAKSRMCSGTKERNQSTQVSVCAWSWSDGLVWLWAGPGSTEPGSSGQTQPGETLGTGREGRVLLSALCQGKHHKARLVRQPGTPAGSRGFDSAPADPSRTSGSVDVFNNVA